MFIKSVYIESFAGMKDREFSFSRGLNIIEGSNESGKSTLCMFIKFIFYGLSGRTSDGEMSERQRYVSWDTGKASGVLTVAGAGGEYRIARELMVFDGSQPKERLEVIDLRSGERVFKGKIPGNCILGIDEKMFVNTVFVRQVGGVAFDGEDMAEAIENILLSGDESLSVKRAVDRLEKSRKALMPKRGAGGSIQLLMQEEARLRSKLEEAKQANSALIAYENEAVRLSALIEKRTREKNKYDSLCRAYKKIEAARRLQKALELQEKIDGLTGELAELEKYGNIPEKVSKINALSARLSGIENRLKGLRRSFGDEPDEFDRMSGEEILTARTDVASAKNSKKKRGVFTVLLCVFAVIGAAASSLCLLFSGKFSAALTYSILGTGAFLLFAGAIFGIIAAVFSAKLRKILKKWGVRDTNGLEREIERSFDRAAAYNRATEERAKRSLEISGCEAERTEVIAALRGAAGVFASDDIPDTDMLVSDALGTAGELLEKKEALANDLAMAKGELRGYSDVLGYDGGNAVARSYEEILETEAGKCAAAFTTKDAALAISKKNFAESALPGLLSQKGEVDANLARIKATTEDTAVLCAQLDSTVRELSAMKRRLAGIEAATEALLSAGESLKSSLMPRIIEEASELMSAFTDGRHSDLCADRGFSLGFTDDGVKRELSYLSSGSADAAYISFRCALSSVIFTGDEPFAVYDESFSRIDEKRLFEILKMLSDTDRQSLVFTCRSLEARIAERLSANITVL